MAKTAPQEKTKVRINVNLLYPQGSPEKIFVKFVRWALSYGRFIVIVVEILVVSAFIARFKLDSDLSALKDEINSKLPYIESKIIDEALINQTQLRLDLIGQNNQNASKWTDTMKKISDQTPLTVQLNSLNITTNDTGTLQFRLNGVSNSNASIGQFLNGLRADPTFKNVNLSNIAIEQDQITFTITGDII